MSFGDDGYFFAYDRSGTNLVHPREPDLVGQNLWEVRDPQGVAGRGGHAVGGCGQLVVGQDLPERAALLRQVDGGRGGADDRDPLGLQTGGEPERAVVLWAIDFAAPKWDELLGVAAFV